MQSIYKRTFVNRADHRCERCGKRPATFHGHADLENGPNPEDMDSGIWIDGKPYQWVCDDCEHVAWVQWHQQAEEACRRYCGPVCVMACYDTEGPIEERGGSVVCDTSDIEEATCTS